jgi:hypothetical protein
MKKLFYLPILFTLVFSLGTNAQKKDSTEKEKEPKKEKTYEEIITKDAITDDGLFKVHKVKDKYYYEIADSLLGRDMLMVTRIVKMATELPLNRHKMSEQVLKWEKFDNNIFLKQASYSKFANDSLPISIAVSNSNFEPIISSFKIAVENKENNSHVIDVTSLYKSDIKIFGFPQSSRKGYKITSLDSKLSFIESIRSFPLNIETKHIKTYKSSDSRNGQISMVLNNSMILLPKEPMKRRYFDERIGWFTSAQTDYGIDNQEAETVRYLDRWRLEIKDEDIDKFKNGELVEPKKPIVYYLDPATPEKWRKYLKDGIEDWNVAFEAAGFKNAVIVKYPPTKEEDPDWSPEDVRYSTVRYLASPSLNANGPHVSDPRSGEIIESDINWYHNVMKLLRNWYFVQTAAVNPDSRSVEFKNEVMGELIRFVSSHEFGHTIGLPHNMGSSSAYPVDSLRSATFTKKYGTSPSIMDYARFNYVAQPGDEGVALMPSQWNTPNVGVYDIYSVKWGYKPILDVSVEEEKSILKSWITEKANDLKYRFGSAGIDPSSQTEDLGDDAVKASEYGIANLKRIMPKLIDWTTKDGETYTELGYMYGQVLGQFGRYMGHVSNNIGGIYQYYKTSDQDGAVYTHVKKSRQQNCMNFLHNQLFETPKWMINKEILNKIEFAGITNRIRSTQSRTLNSLLDFGKMARLIENEAINGKNAYSLIEMMTDLRKGIFNEVYKNKTIDVYRRNLQLAYIDRISYLMSNEQGSTPSWARNYVTSVKVSQSDIRTVATNQLIELRKDLKKHKNKSDKMTKIHLEMVQNKISSILIGKPI